MPKSMELEPLKQSPKKLPVWRRALYFGLPMWSAISAALFARTATAPFWLEHDLDTRLLGLWFTVLNVSQLAAIVSAPARRVTFCAAVAVALVQTLGALWLERCPSVIWVFALAGFYDPLTPAMLRLRDENCGPREYDATSSVMFSGLMVGLLVASSGGTLLEGSGVEVVAFVVAGSAWVVVASHAQFVATPGAPTVVRFPSLEDEHQDVLQGPKMLGFMAGIMLGVGIVDAALATVAPLYWRVDLDSAAWTLFAAWIAAFVLSSLHASVWAALNLTFTPKVLNIALLVASSLFATLATCDPNLLLAAGGVVMYSLCANVVHLTSFRVVESYAASKAVFERYAVYHRISYTLGTTLGSLVGPFLYFSTKPKFVFLLLAVTTAAMAAASSYVFLQNTVNIAANQLLRLVDLEDSSYGAPDSDELTPKDEEQRLFENPPLSPRRFLLTARDNRKSLMDLVRDLKDFRPRATPGRPLRGGRRSKSSTTLDELAAASRRSDDSFVGEDMLPAIVPPDYYDDDDDCKHQEATTRRKV